MSAPYSGDDANAKLEKAKSVNQSSNVDFPAFRSPARMRSYQASPGRLDKSPSTLRRYRQSAGQNMLNVSRVDGSTHFVGIDELDFYASFVNQELAEVNVPHSKIPVDEDNLIKSCNDGIIFCYLLNSLEPGIISEKLMHTNDPLSNYHKGINCNLAINALKELGAQIVNIGASDLINEKAHPQLKRLKKKGESDKDFSTLPVEQVLLRWFNHQLTWAGCDRSISNFDSDLADGHCYMELLHKLGHGRTGANIIARKKYAKPEEIANLVINAASTDLNVKPLIQAHHIREGNSKLNMAFIAQLFNAVPEIEDTSKYEERISSFQTLFRRHSCKNLDSIKEHRTESTVSESSISVEKAREAFRGNGTGVATRFITKNIGDPSEEVRERILSEGFENVRKSVKSYSGDMNGDSESDATPFYAEYASRLVEYADKTSTSYDNGSATRLIMTNFNDGSGAVQPPKQFYEALIPSIKRASNTETKAREVSADEADTNASTAGKKGAAVKIQSDGVYQSMRGAIDSYHEKYYMPVAASVSDWAKRNPTVVSVAEKVVKPVTVVSALSIMQMMFQVSSEMSLAGAL